MIERIADMPEGTIGLRSSGRLTREDYVEVLEPALKAATEAGEMRLLFVLDDFDGVEPGAWVDDVKTGLNAIFRHHGDWERFAFATDVEWIAKATRAFSWLVPGELKVVGLGEVEQAKAWLAS